MIYIVTYKHGHHYSVSGYNRLAEFIPCRKISIPPLVQTLLQRTTTFKRLENLKSETGLLGYFPECLWLEWWTTQLARIPVNSIFHFVFPENSYYFSSIKKKSPKAKFVATYHQPLNESRMYILKTDAIKKLDAVVLLSETQREFFDPLVGQDRIFIIPHGIDLDFFKPAIKLFKEKRIISVGNWLRDFSTLTETLKILEKKDPSITCDVITLESNRTLFKDLSNVRFHAGISDAKLLELYNQASLSVLSLTGAAANNALLETLACGLPMVVTDLPAVREYTPSEGCRYAESGNALNLAENILSILNDEDKCNIMGICNRKHAERYDWKVVAKKTMKVYEALS